MMSSDFGGMGMPSLGMGMPPMRGMEMPGFPSMPGMSIEEMASMPPPTPSQTPREDYTVTSPPMSPPPEMNHKVRSSGLHGPRTKPDRRGDRPVESERWGRV